MPVPVPEPRLGAQSDKMQLLIFKHLKLHFGCALKLYSLLNADCELHTVAREEVGLAGHGERGAGEEGCGPCRSLGATEAGKD